MTAAGYAALGEELKRRQQVERPRIIQQIAEARSHGDLSENAEYHAAKEAHWLMLEGFEVCWLCRLLMALATFSGVMLQPMRQPVIA